MTVTALRLEFQITVKRNFLTEMKWRCLLQEGVSANVGNRGDSRRVHVDIDVSRRLFRQTSRGLEVTTKVASRPELLWL